jgi:hypothetical protein
MLLAATAIVVSGMVFLPLFFIVLDSNIQIMIGYYQKKIHLCSAIAAFFINFLNI